MSCFFIVSSIIESTGVSCNALLDASVRHGAGHAAGRSVQNRHAYFVRSIQRLTPRDGLR
jgi:hypothetical protein